MEIYENENDQVEAVKRFFAENGKALAPSGSIGQGIQREHQLPVDQPQSPLFRLGQGIAVQVKQTKITRHPP